MKLALPAGLSPATATFEASRSDILSYGSVEIGGPPRIRTEFHPGKSRSFTVKVCDPNATRLTRRSSGFANISKRVGADNEIVPQSITQQSGDLGRWGCRNRPGDARELREFPNSPRVKMFDQLVARGFKKPRVLRSAVN